MMKKTEYKTKKNQITYSSKQKTTTKTDVKMIKFVDHAYDGNNYMQRKIKIQFHQMELLVCLCTLRKMKLHF